MVLDKVLVDNQQVGTMPVLPDETPGADHSSMRMVLPYFRYNATFDPSFTVLVATNGTRISRKASSLSDRMQAALFARLRVTEAPSRSKGSSPIPSTCPL
jgi:hypothetical protein